MHEVGRSLWDFIRGTWGALLSAFAAVSDPLDLSKAAGLVDSDTTWALGDGAMRAIFALFAIGWFFVWFHNQRSKPETPKRRRLIPLHRALQYVARDSIWAASYDAPDTNWVIGLRTAFQRELSHGTITAFGYKEISTWVLEPGVTKLDPDVWRQASLDISHLAGVHPPKRVQVDYDHYDYIEVDLDEVKTVFPPRSKAAAKGGKSPVERIGNYEQLWAEQERKYEEAMKNRHLTPAERFYKDDRPTPA